MRYVLLVIALVLSGCVDVQGDAESAYARYQGRPVQEIAAVWGSPIREGVNENGPVYTFYGTSASTVGSTSTTTGFFGNIPITATTETSTPTTIACRVQVFTDANRRVIGFRNEGARGACSAMYRRLQHQ